MTLPSRKQLEALRSRLSSFARRLAPAAYLAKGALYVVIGLMAADAALNPGEGLEGAGEAIRAIRTQPLGLLGAGVLLLGLSAYVAWQASRALLDPEQKAHGLRGIGFRLVTFSVAVVYGALVLQGFEMLGSGPSGTDGDAGARWLGAMLASGFGRMAVMAVGGGVVIFGISQLARAFNPRTYAAAQHRWLAGGGYAVRGTISGLIGWFIFAAAHRRSRGEFKDLEEVLATVRQQPAGNLLLFTLAMGLVAYGMLQLARARIWHKHGSE